MPCTHKVGFRTSVKPKKTEYKEYFYSDCDFPSSKLSLESFYALCFSMLNCYYHERIMFQNKYTLAYTKQYQARTVVKTTSFVKARQVVWMCYIVDRLNHSLSLLAIVLSLLGKTFKKLVFANPVTLYGRQNYWRTLGQILTSYRSQCRYRCHHICTGSKHI